MVAEKSGTSSTERQKTKNFSNFALSHMDAMRILRDGKVLGPESEGWRNIAEHCLLAGVTAYTLGKLVGLSQEDLQELTNVALTHDWDKRLQKEQTQSEKTRTAGGLVMTETDSKTLDQMGRGKHGIERVTGHDLRDFDTWNTKEKIMRFVDSCLGTEPDGRAVLQNWHERFEGLRKRSPRMNIDVGNELYGGVPLFDKLEEITQIVEKELFEQVIKNNPGLFTKYLTPSDLLMMTESAILADAEKEK